jgi:glycine/D-amino acid oxidase-like deaminating enzyme
MPYGFGVVKQSGYVEVLKLLISYRKFLEKKGIIIDSVVNHDEIQIRNDGVLWKGLHARCVIFCEGHRTVGNPFFNWLPFRLTKGETLLIRVEPGVFPENYIINRGINIMHVQGQEFLVGSTFDWNSVNQQPSEKGKNAIIGKLDKCTTEPYEIISHRAGIRPTVRDRRPLIGMHPEHKNIGIFNGLGTKGVLLAPFFAKQFSGYLLNENELHPEADIARFRMHCCHKDSNHSVGKFK